MKPCVIILGAGAPPEGNQPFGVQQVTLGRRILDWQLDAFAPLHPEIHFVGGYEFELVQQHFPKLTYHHNIHWRETGAVASLALALQEMHVTGDIYIIYADILLRPSLVQALAHADAAHPIIACDRPRPQQNRPPEMLDGKEFIGLVRVPAGLVKPFVEETLRRTAAAPRAHLSQLFASLNYTVLDAHHLWAHAEFGRSIARFVMGSKATTLARLQSRLTHSGILPLCYFTRRQFQQSPDEAMGNILQQFAGSKHLVVRSSATDEDGFTQANAGRYHSELNVAPTIAAVHAPTVPAPVSIAPAIVPTPGIVHAAIPRIVIPVAALPGIAPVRVVVAGGAVEPRVVPTAHAIAHVPRTAPWTAVETEAEPVPVVPGRIVVGAVVVAALLVVGGFVRVVVVIAAALRLRLCHRFH